MKKIFRISVLVLVVLMLMPSEGFAQKKKKKEKKEKEPYVWVMPELTGNETFDTYLLTCDTIFNAIKTYRENLTFYDVKKIQLKDGQGNIVKDENGNPKEVYAVVDENNIVRNGGRALLQYTEIILAGTNILLDMANLTLLTTSATTSLPNLGLKAISYAKYIKAGPMALKDAGIEIKEIIASCKEQAKRIKAYKKGFTESGELLDPSIDPSNIDGVNLADAPTVVKPEKEFEDEILAAIEDGKNVGEINEDVFDEDMFEEDLM